MAAVPPMKTLAQCGDVLTDYDLCCVLRITERQLRSLKSEESSTERAILPPRLPLRSRRYARVDVETWIKNGGASSRHLRRSA